MNAELRNTVGSQSEALKIARTTLHSQRADIERLRLALEAGGVRGSGKVDARAVNEAQRLSAELSRTQEELERARTSSEEYAFLRREMTRLAQNILAAARTQGTMVPQQRMVMEVAQAFPQFGGLETHEEPHQHEAPHAAPEARQYAQPEASHYATNGVRNGASHEMAQTDMVVETVVEEYEEMSAASLTEMARAMRCRLPRIEIEAEAPKASIAQRFAARREAALAQIVRQRWRRRKLARQTARPRRRVSLRPSLTFRSRAQEAA